MMKILFELLFVLICVACKGESPLTGNTKITNKKEQYYSTSDSVFIKGVKTYALIIKSEYSKDTLDIIDYRESSYSSPIILKQFAVFTANGKIIKEYKLPIKNIKKKTLEGTSLNVLQTPIYEIGIVKTNKGFYYAIWGSDYCNGDECLEFIGIYNCEGYSIFEGITNNNKEKIKKILHIYEIDINLKSASNLNGNLNCSKELEHYSS